MQQKSSFYGGNKFHSSTANWDPHNSIDRQSLLLYSKSIRQGQAEAQVDSQFYSTLDLIRCHSRTRRPQMKIKVLQPGESFDHDKPQQFKATPSDDIPRNKLTERLARGL